MNLSHILQVKGRHVHTASIGDSVLVVTQNLVSHNVGALVVLDKSGKVCGIVTERDILRLSAKSENLATLCIENYMTRQLITANSEATVDDAMTVMTDRHIRHLPIVENGELEGIVSQGDLVKAKLEDAQHEAHQLTNFVLGKYPA